MMHLFLKYSQITMHLYFRRIFNFNDHEQDFNFYVKILFGYLKTNHFLISFTENVIPGSEKTVYILFRLLPKVVLLYFYN